MRIGFVSLFILIASATQAQVLVAYEDSIAKSYAALAAALSDDEKRAHAEAMERYFEASLAQPGAFDYPFSRLNMMKATSSDGRLRIFNWNLPYNDGTFRYYGFVVIRNLKTGEWNTIKLTDSEREIEKVEGKFLTPDKWMGALYFEIVPVKHKRKEQSETYVLLGWDGKDNVTTRKVIDAVTVTGPEKIRFGAPIFETPKGTQKRMIMEYSHEVSASVKYYPKKKCIVMDHVSPKAPELRGIYAEYGPDGTYDLLEFEKGKWILRENIDVGQFATDDDRPYNDPSRMR
jgi:hypothetical protein